MYCEIDFSPVTCCDDGLHGLFTDRPLFTSHGVCFTSIGKFNGIQYLLKPSVKSPLKFAMNVSKKYSTGILTHSIRSLFTGSNWNIGEVLAFLT